MNTSILTFTIIRSPKTKFSDSQILLGEWTGKDFSRNDAETVWENVISHKWTMSERLGRDVGLRVAAVDFIENFYQPSKGVKKTAITSKREIKISAFIKNIVRLFFETKGAFINF